MYKGKVSIAGMDTSSLPVMQESEKVRLLCQMRDGNPDEKEKGPDGAHQRQPAVGAQRHPAFFPGGARVWTTCSRSAASGSSKRLTTSISARKSGFPPTPYR